MRQSPAAIGLWTTALAVGVLWPGRALSALDGIPLNGRAEAVVIGVLLPMLWVLGRAFLARPLARTAIVAILALKVISSIALTKQGLCLKFSTAAPFGGVTSTIEIDEPEGALRSWDVRADWRSRSPRCTAILDRSYRSQTEFPAAFLELLTALRPSMDGTATLDLSGFVTSDVAGQLAIDTGAKGTITVGSFSAGTHPIAVHTVLSRGEWRLTPLWNGGDAWRAVRFTTQRPSIFDRAAPAMAWLTSALIAGFIAVFAASVAASWGVRTPAFVWTVTLTALMFAAGFTGWLERYAAAALVGATFVPVARHQQHSRTAVLMIGVPWMALFVGHGWSSVGRLTAYTIGDDWHVFQSAAYSIFLNGDWMRGGSPTFYYQPLYRWMIGVLHMIFGDSSVGQVFWDAGCLFAAVMVPFAIVKRTAGYRWAMAACATTLAIFAISPIWYLVGRGLAEIAALGWLALSALWLMRARSGRIGTLVVAAMFAVLMFVTRTNHMLIPVFLLALLIPPGVPVSVADVWRAAQRVRPAMVIVFAGIIATGLALYAFHSWWYTGHFSVTYGTSYGLQRIGLTPSTIFVPAVWGSLAEAFSAQLFMREPPAFDVRAVFVVVGAIASVLAVLQVPFFKTLPASLTIMTVGTLAGTFIVHTHEYPGRTSVHVVPFAVAVSVCLLASLTHRLTQSRAPAEIGRRLPVAS